jgi:hypothetical protein
MSRSGAVAGAVNGVKRLPLENPELRAKRVAGLAKANAMLKEHTKVRWHGSRITNGKTLLPGVDGRNTWARRLRDLIQLHLSDLGGEDNASEAEKNLVRRACALTVELELLESKFAAVNNGALPKDLDLYGRTAGNLRRILETLGMTRRAKDITPSIERFIANYGEDEVEEAEVVDG